MAVDERSRLLESHAPSEAPLQNVCGSNRSHPAIETLPNDVCEPSIMSV